MPHPLTSVLAIFLRQLEDQRVLMERNRLPKLDGLLRGLRERQAESSLQQERGREGEEGRRRLLARIVQEATGVHVVLLPERSHKAEEEEQPLHASKAEIRLETAPFLRPYRRECRANPVMCSYGTN